MATQLPLTVLRLIAIEMLSRNGLIDAFHLSLTSQAVHDTILPLILNFNTYHVTTLRKHICDYGTGQQDQTPRSLGFFIKSDNATLVERYLDSTGMNVNSILHQTRKRIPILDYAVQENASSVVAYLLREGANPSIGSRNRIYTPPLLTAVECGQIPIAKLLLENGTLQAMIEEEETSNAEFYTTSTAQNEAIYWLICRAKFAAANKNDDEMVKLLISYCSKPNQNARGPSILHDVCGCGISDYKEIIETLVRVGVDINALDTGRAKHGRCIRRTPLNYAVCNPAKTDIIQALLDMGAQGAPEFDIQGPEIVSYRSQKPSRKPGHRNMFWHRKKGLCYGPPDNKPRVSLVYAAPTPLHDLLSSWPSCWDQISWWKTNEADICRSVKLLIDHGLVGPQGILDANQTLLVDIMFTCAQIQADSSELWTILLDGGVFDVHHRNEFGQTFLAQLISRCYGGKLVQQSSWKPNLLRALVEAGSDPNTVDASDLTPLHWAILYGDFDTASLLIELGADPAKEVNGSTPTHYAFGKPFARRGPVARRVMSSLQRRLFKILRGSWGQRHRLDDIPLSEFRRRRWHPVLSVSSDPNIRVRCEALAKDSERLLYSIMALLLPWADASTDENGHTPRDIAQSRGILGKGDSLVLRLDRICPLEGICPIPNDDSNGDSDDDSDNYSVVSWGHVSEYDPDYELYKEAENIYYKHILKDCTQCCPFCYSFPPPLLDLGTDEARPIVITELETAKDGKTSSAG
ncbi:ankyrin repeat-containing domain protein [Xylariaceae sp. AK1471]|nr:ankyrin repeat-containing domain protein [Xylariaceae sp. AK1471]